MEELNIIFSFEFVLESQRQVSREFFELRAQFSINQFQIELPHVANSFNSFWQLVGLGSVSVDALAWTHLSGEESSVPNLSILAVVIIVALPLVGFITRVIISLFGVFSFVSGFFVYESQIESVFGGFVPGDQEVFEPEGFTVSEISNIGVGYTLWERFVVTVVAVSLGVLAAGAYSRSSLLSTELNLFLVIKIFLADFLECSKTSPGTANWVDCWV